MMMVQLFVRTPLSKITSLIEMHSRFIIYQLLVNTYLFYIVG
jgi:hypothetical protein